MHQAALHSLPLCQVGPSRGYRARVVYSSVTPAAIAGDALTPSGGCCFMVLRSDISRRLLAPADIVIDPQAGRVGQLSGARQAHHTEELHGATDPPKPQLGISEALPCWLC